MRTRTAPWEYDREMYGRRNEIKRLLRRLPDFRRMLPRFAKFAVGLIAFALSCEALR